MPNFTTPSLRWRIFDRIASELASAPELQGVSVVRNPLRPPPLPDGAYLIVVRWNSDSLVTAPGQKETRRMRLVVASLVNAADADREADAMQEQVNVVMRRIWPQINDITMKVLPREGDVTPDVEGLLISGALVASAWDVEYEKPFVVVPRPAP